MLQQCFNKTITNSSSSSTSSTSSTSSSTCRDVSFDSFNCYVGSFHPSDASYLARQPGVSSVEPDSNFTIVSPYYRRNHGNHDNRRRSPVKLSLPLNLGVSGGLGISIGKSSTTSTVDPAATDTSTDALRRPPRPVRGRSTTTSAITSTVASTVAPTVTVASCNGYSAEGPSPSAPPNLDRIDQESNNLDGIYNYPSSAGNGVDVYVVDTGIYLANNEFEGRAFWGKTECSGCPDSDDNGHGTNVAGIIGGKIYGVAKNCNLYAVKVCDSGGSCQNSDIISGLVWCMQQHSNSGRSSVINLSLSGGYSTSLNNAVQSCIAQGMHVVCAAGNDDDDSCSYSPSSAPNCTAVGATDNSANMASFSNYGTCVDIFAPGNGIVAAGSSSPSDLSDYIGTSQAAPHVAGAIALMISDSGDFAPADMKNKLINSAAKNKVNGTLNKSPNVFLRVPHC
ncbi:573_t:CDS:2 [Dentiscutata erythropus]|uniref:573_t:CDS:1 n=1 Tax=Dentiscutata erythropus TaxID=1348616 RepID=A0A9N9D2I8_9GLOM|nr:573_t:CDS:2 [Dentiscutata erythropus]